MAWPPHDSFYWLTLALSCLLGITIGGVVGLIYGYWIGKQRGPTDAESR